MKGTLRAGLRSSCPTPSRFLAPSHHTALWPRGDRLLTASVSSPGRPVTAPGHRPRPLMLVVSGADTGRSSATCLNKATQVAAAGRWRWLAVWSPRANASERRRPTGVGGAVRPWLRKK